jgi:hypothetical protein
MNCTKAVWIIGIACFLAFAVLTRSAAGKTRDRNQTSEGLVSQWSGEDNAGDSAGKHHGRVVGAVKYAKGMSGKAFSLDGSAYIDFGNPVGLRITGNQTIAMWLKPARLGLRQNPLAKAYGGECTFTLEPTGVLNYIYGTSGRNTHPYAVIGSGACFKVGKWTHFAVVRDFKAKKLRFYINGMLRNEIVPKFTKTKASSLSMYLGKGYVNNYSGLIDEVCIWNRALDAWEVSAAAGSVPLAAPVISRNAKLDSVHTADGSLLLGTIENKDWSITTSYGKFNIRPARVVGLLSRPAASAATSQPASSPLQMALIDGQVLVGRLSDPFVKLKLPGGQMLRIPIALIKQCAYRIDPKKPVVPENFRQVDEKFPATVMLNSGDYLSWDSSGIAMRFKSDYGTLDLRPDTTVAITAAGGDMRRVNLKDSSAIMGTLALAKVKLKLKLGKEISVPIGNVRFLHFPVEIAKPIEATAVSLRNGDRLVGKLGDKQLAVRTNYGLVNVPTANIRRIRCQADGASELTMQTSTVLRGKLTAESMAMILGSGMKFSLPIDRIASVVFPRKLPGELVKKIEALIKELDDASEAKRKSASKELIAMGKDVLIVLKRHGNSSRRVQAVIDKLEGVVRPDPVLIRWHEQGGRPALRL